MLVNNKFVRKLSESEIESLLKVTVSELSQAPSWDAETLKQVLNHLLESTQKKPAELFSLIRLAVSFAPFSPALDLTLETLGRDKTLARLNAVARSI